MSDTHTRDAAALLVKNGRQRQSPSPGNTMACTYAYWVHIDPSRNRRRWYTLCLQPTLFGEIDLVCQWGRLGDSGGQRQVTTYPSDAAAALAAESVIARRKLHGYQLHLAL